MNKKISFILRALINRMRLTRNNIKILRPQVCQLQQSSQMLAIWVNG